MEIKNFIKIYDNCMQPETISSLIKWLEKQKFEDGAIGFNDSNVTRIIDTQIRNTQVLGFADPSSGSQTRIHWNNFLGSILLQSMNKYLSELSKTGGIVKQIESIDALKYTVGGQYVFHVDSGPSTPRTLSAVLLLNNDYEGGELCFSNPINLETYLKINPVPGRLIIWPSNFLYPHAVTPVQKGKRYSIVSWAL